jgi:dihydrofolate reductase
MKLIVAYCRNNGIGLKNTLPWKLQADLSRFKYLTIGDGNNAVVMGKNTWKSLNHKSLPKRSNIVLTSTPNFYSLYPQTFLSSLQQVNEYCEKEKYDEIWLIGGEAVYKEALNNDLISDIYTTFVNKDYNCDTFFPSIPNTFKLTEKSAQKNENNINYNYNHYEKIYRS